MANATEKTRGSHTWKFITAVLIVTAILWGLSVLYFENYSPNIEPNYAPMRVGR
jgi:hypothetical protein